MPLGPGAKGEPKPESLDVTEVEDVVEDEDEGLRRLFGGWT